MVDLGKDLQMTTTEVKKPSHHFLMLELAIQRTTNGAPIKLEYDEARRAMFVFWKYQDEKAPTTIRSNPTNTYVVDEAGQRYPMDGLVIEKNGDFLVPPNLHVMHSRNRSLSFVYPCPGLDLGETVSDSSTRSVSVTLFFTVPDNAKIEKLLLYGGHLLL